MKNLGEKENKKKNKLDYLNTIYDRNIIEKISDDMMKGLNFIILLLILLVIVVFILVSLDAFADIIP